MAAVIHHHLEDVTANQTTSATFVIQATIANDVNVLASTEALTLTTLAATVALDVDIAANTEAFLIQEQKDLK